MTGSARLEQLPVRKGLLMLRMDGYGHHKGKMPGGDRVLMVRLRFCLFVAVTVAGLAGCTRPAAEAPSVSPVALIPGETVLAPVDEPPFIKVKLGDEWLEISPVDEYPSSPVISPDQRRMAYIAPYEFEMAGQVYLYTAGDREGTVLLGRDSIPGRQTPYRLMWMDEAKLAVLLGYQYGTIPSRRELLEVDVTTGAKRTILEVSERQDIREMALEPDGEGIRLVVAEYNEDFTDAVEKTMRIDLR